MNIKEKIILATVLVLGTSFLAGVSYAQSDVADGDLIRGEGMNRVYFLQETEGELLKRWIPSPAVFNAYQPHFSWGNIKEVEPVVVNEFEEGSHLEIGEGIFGLAAISSTIENPGDYFPAGIGEYMRLASRVPVYSTLDRAQARNHFTYHGGEGVWVNVRQREWIGGEEFALIRWGNNVSGWVRSSALGSTAPLSQLRGVELEKYPGEQLAMVYVERLNVRSVPGVMNAESLVGQIHKYDLIFVQEERFAGGALWYRIGNDEWIHSAYVRNFTPGSRPAGVGPGEKWIEVNLAEQVVIAHQGDTPVYATLTATGRQGHETITGLFRPWLKIDKNPARGARFDLTYDLADTPWWSFFSGDYGWHGAYWHDNFGTQQSAGCVNLSPFDSHWMFQWSDPALPAGQSFIRPGASNPATWVYVHRGL